MVERLVLDNEEIENAWHEIAKQLRDPENMSSLWLLLEKTREFEGLQREHLIRENKNFLPRFEALLSSLEQTIIGRLMSNMRGLNTILTAGYLFS